MRLSKSVHASQQNDSQNLKRIKSEDTQLDSGTFNQIESSETSTEESNYGKNFKKARIEKEETASKTETIEISYDSEISSINTSDHG